jgi:hypothetical protein
MQALRQDQLLQQLYARLPQERRDYRLLKSGSIELHPHDAIFLVEGNPPHSIDFANTINGAHCAFSGRSRVAVSNFQ